MQLLLGHILTNSTARFLSPILNTFNSSFLANFKPVQKHVLGYAIGDVKYDKAKHQKHTYLLFIICDINGVYLPDKQRYLQIENGRKIFTGFLDSVKKSSYYYDDYILDGTAHCVILEIPKEWYIAYDNFIKGHYSKMYTKTQIKAFFSSKDNIGVLTKDSEYKEIFVEKLNQRFNTHVKPEDLPADIELEVPPFEDDILNYNYEQILEHTGR